MKPWEPQQRKEIIETFLLWHKLLEGHGVTTPPEIKYENGWYVFTHHTGRITRHRAAEVTERTNRFKEIFRAGSGMTSTDRVKRLDDALTHLRQQLEDLPADDYKSRPGEFLCQLENELSKLQDEINRGFADDSRAVRIDCETPVAADLLAQLFRRDSVPHEQDGSMVFYPLTERDRVTRILTTAFVLHPAPPARVEKTEPRPETTSPLFWKPNPRYVSAIAARLWAEFGDTVHNPFSREFIERAVRIVLQPCLCDPPGAGEEFCTGDCEEETFKTQLAIAVYAHGATLHFVDQNEPQILLPPIDTFPTAREALTYARMEYPEQTEIELIHHLPRKWILFGDPPHFIPEGQLKEHQQYSEEQKGRELDN